MSDTIRRLVVDATFDRTLVETMRAMQLEGLDIITRFDLREHLQRHVHHECRRYVLLQVGSPELMLKALQTDIESGAFLPVTLAIYELADGETAVEATRPFAAVADQAWRQMAPDLAVLGDREAELIVRALNRIEHAARMPVVGAVGVGA